jgi:hypothetical protein
VRWGGAESCRGVGKGLRKRVGRCCAAAATRPRRRAIGALTGGRRTAGTLPEGVGEAPSDPLAGWGVREGAPSQLGGAELVFVIRHNIYHK